jgi:YjzC-like protein
VTVPIPQREDFYLSDSPYHLQQGDILQGVPLITPPAARELVILRGPGRRYSYPLDPSTNLEAVREGALADAFDNDHPEFVAVTVQRVPAVLITPTCDLDKREVWQFVPIREIPADAKKDIFAGKMTSLFPVHAIEEAGLNDSVIDVGDVRLVRREAIRPDLRLKSLSPDACSALSEIIVRAAGRVWGYKSGELVPEDGIYRCARDNAHYDLKHEPKLQELKKGDQFPECPNCSWSHKSAQWYRLTKAKRRS